MCYAEKNSRKCNRTLTNHRRNSLVYKEKSSETTVFEYLRNYKAVLVQCFWEAFWQSISLNCLIKKEVRLQIKDKTVRNSLTEIDTQIHKWTLNISKAIEYSNTQRNNPRFCNESEWLLKSLNHRIIWVEKDI